MKHRSYNLILATMMVPGLLMFSNKAFASTGTIQMDDFSVPVGGTVTVPLNLNIADGDLKGFRFTLEYDKSVVEIVDWADIDLNDAFPLNQHDNDPSPTETTSQIAAFNPTTSLTGNVTLANVTFTAKSTVADSTIIKITASDLYGTDDQPYDNINQLEMVTATVTDAMDTTPNQFELDELTNVNLGSVHTSVPIEVTGINQPAPISIQNGEYAINEGEFTSEFSNVNEGDIVTVRSTASMEYFTTTVATLTIGGISSGFELTTIANPEPTAPVFGTIGDPFNAIVNVPFTFTAHAHDENGDPLTFTLSENAPSGAEIDPVTGVFTWTPTVADEFTFDITVTDGITMVTESVTIVAENIAPEFQAIGDPFDAIVNVPFTFTAQATDQNEDPLTYLLGENAPEGAVIDSGTGEFSWTPTTTGEFTFDISVSDGTLNVTESVTIIVSEEIVNNAPEFEAVDGPLYTNKKAPTTFIFHAHDEDGDELVYSLGENAPEGATIDPQTGEFFWIPQMEGEFTFDIIVSDGQDTDTESVTIIVGPQLDYVPGPFDLTPIFNAEPGSVQTSNEITITDIEAPITIAIHGNDGEYSINGGEFTSAEGTVFLGDKVVVRQTASAQLGSTVTTTLHLAGLSEDFNVTTRGETLIQPAVDDDSCGRDCERYKEYRREYKSDENKKIYQKVKEMKKKDPERFRYLRELYTENKHLTSDEREEALNDKTLWEFKMYKKYNGYRHYRNLKEKVD